MAERMLIVGLGNPGSKYSKTRHNIGFMVLDKLAEQKGLSYKKGRGPYETAVFVQKSQPIILAKPLTFMNNSGQAVAELLHYFDIDLAQLLIVFDDIELPFGRIRLRAQGSSGGHNGLESVLQHINSKNFARLRIGIGTEYAKRDMIKFVLSSFSRNEQKDLDAIIDRSIDAVLDFIEYGIDFTMNRYNSL